MKSKMACITLVLVLAGCASEPNDPQYYQAKAQCNAQAGQATSGYGDIGVIANRKVFWDCMHGYGY